MPEAERSPIPALADKGIKERNISTHTPSFAVTGVGAIGAAQAVAFLEAIKHSHAHGEFLGTASFFGIDASHSLQARVDHASGVPLWNPNKPLIVFNDVAQAAADIAKRSIEHGHISPIIIHFLSFDSRNKDVVTKGTFIDTIRTYPQLGVLTIPRQNDPVTRRYFEKALSTNQHTALGIPLMVRDANQHTDQAFAAGFAGFFAAHKLLPRLNPYPPIEYLTLLREESEKGQPEESAQAVIGVSIAEDDTPVIRHHLVLQNIAMNDLVQRAPNAVITSLQTKPSSLIKRKEGSEFDVVVVQLPLHHNDPYLWRETDIMKAVSAGVADAARKGEIDINPDNLVILYSSTDATPNKNHMIPIVATHFYPAELV